MSGFAILSFAHHRSGIRVLDHVPGKGFAKVSLQGDHNKKQPRKEVLS